MISDMGQVVALAVSDGVPVFELAAPCAIFGTDRSELTGSDWYTFRVCSPPRARIDQWFSAATPYTYDSLVDADTVIVPACHDADFAPPQDLVDAVAAAASRGARVASICTGVCVLAAAGLLDGRRAATHWLHAPILAERFPNVIIDADPLYIDHGDVLTSAGKSAGTDLCLHLVRTDYGAYVANQVARRLVAPPHREGHQRQYMEPAPTLPADDIVANTMDWALGRLDQPVTVEDMARYANVSSRTLHRRFFGRTGVTPLEWLNNQRIRRAQQLLETTVSPVERIASACGFGTAASLRRHFRDTLNITPDAYRRTFSTETR